MNILKDRGIVVSENWLQQKPVESVVKDEYTITWDMQIITDKKVKCNKPDILIHDSKNNTCLIIDVAVPLCNNIVSKAAEKITKYKELEIELKKYWNLDKVQTIPIICGALGTVGKNIDDYLINISKKLRFDIIKKTALLGTAHIIRNVITSA